jgi:hypothetical protein
MNDSIFQKIKNEKRRRNQLYITLDYFLNSGSYYDFFSKDSLKLVLKTKGLTSLLNKKIITSDLFFLSFFDKKLGFKQLFKTYFVEKEGLKRFFLKLKNLDSGNLKFKNFFSKFFEKSITELDESFLAQEMELLFEKASINASERFKTPIISPEILFITLMEDKNNAAFKLIKQLTGTETNWHLLRYQLMKRIYSHESIIKNESFINQQYFAYLLKIQLSNSQFNRLIEEKLLVNAVSLFRNTLVSLTLNEDIFDNLLTEIFHSIKLSNFRKYSA